MSEKKQVKLTQTQKNRLKHAPRIAVGGDLSLDPKSRLEEAGRSRENRGLEVTVSVKAEEPMEFRYVGRTSGFKRGRFFVRVVDGEVYLDGRYHGHAFGMHDPYFESWYYDEPNRNPYDSNDSKPTHAKLLLVQADKVAKAMQNLLADSGEPVPDADEIEKQRLEWESQVIGSTLHNFDHIIRALRKSDQEETLDLASDVAKLKAQAIDIRDALDIKALEAEAMVEIAKARAALT